MEHWDGNDDDDDLENESDNNPEARKEESVNDSSEPVEENMDAGDVEFLFLFMLQMIGFQYAI